MLLLLLAMILISLGMACATCPVCAPSPGNEGPRPSGEFDDGDFEDPDPVGARGDEFCVIEMVSPSLPNPAPTTSRRRRVFRAPTNPTASSTTHAH